jgi:hypothetical protein
VGRRVICDQSKASHKLHGYPQKACPVHRGDLVLFKSVARYGSSRVNSKWRHIMIHSVILRNRRRYDKVRRRRDQSSEVLICAENGLVGVATAKTVLPLPGRQPRMPHSACQGHDCQTYIPRILQCFCN